jgi:hypothetical protein
MIPFKFISVEQQQLISDKLYDYVIHHTDILKNAWQWNTLKKDDVLKFVPELAAELRKIIDADITMIAIVYRKPNEQGGIHIDNGRATRVLWPVRNCAGSYTKFFDLNGNGVIEKFGKEGDRFLDIGKTFPLKEIAAVELTSPVVFDSGIPHGVYTNPILDEPRLTATIAFNKDIKYLLQ